MRVRLFLMVPTLACLACLAGAAGARDGDSPPASDAAPATATLAVGSKRFTESYVLGELLAETARRAGTPALHRSGLGTTGIVFAALRTGAIDVYVEYTGTIERDILGRRGPDAPAASIEALDRALRPQGLGVAVPLGFDNGYALAMRRDTAQRADVRRISDLAGRPALRLAFTQEFLALPAGWPGLARAYGLAQAPAGIEHGLAYDALAAGRIDVKEVYTTDARILRDDLLVLEDDRAFFARYDAVLLYRRDLPERLPRAWAALAGLEGRIDTGAMRRMNAAVEIERLGFDQAARTFLDRAESPAKGHVGAPGSAPGPARDPASTHEDAAEPRLGSSHPVAARSLWSALTGTDLWPLTVQHVLLVALSLAAAVAAGVPLGMVAHRHAVWGAWILGTIGVLQTIPALALLALLIAVTGLIGTLPALAALSLYALLPVVRNTQAGLAGVGDGLRDASRALGLRPLDTLLRIELPLAMPTLLAGVETAAVLSVGTATIAAFVGAGGYGARIVQGLALNDATMLLAGALPSAALALGVQAAFAAARRASARPGRT